MTSPVDVVAFHLKEYEVLRGLIAAYIKDINNLQYYFLGGCAAVYGFCVQQKLDGIYSILYALPFLFTVFAWVTYESFREEICDIREYLITLESSIATESKGFDVYYNKRYNNRNHSLMRMSRRFFWISALAVNFVCPILFLIPNYCK